MEGLTSSTDDDVLQSRLIRHCIICLRKVQKNRNSTGIRTVSTEHYHVVPEADMASSEEILSSFNEFWLFIRKMNCGGVGNYGCGRENNRKDFRLDDDVLTHGITNNRKRKRSEIRDSSLSEPSSTFSRLPTMCKFCVNGILQIDRLLKAIRTQVDELQKIITDSNQGGQYSWRGERLENDLKNSGLDAQEITCLFNFLLRGSADCSATKKISDPPLSSAVSTSCDAGSLLEITKDRNTTPIDGVISHKLGSMSSQEQGNDEMDNQPIERTEETGEDISDNEDDTWNNTDTPDYVKSEDEDDSVSPFENKNEEEDDEDSAVSLENREEEEDDDSSWPLENVDEDEEDDSSWPLENEGDNNDSDPDDREAELEFEDTIKEETSDDESDPLSHAGVLSKSIIASKNQSATEIDSPIRPEDSNTAPATVSPLPVAPSTTNIVTHQENSSHQNNKPYKCEVKDCFKSFHSKDKLDIHQQIGHANIHRYICGCGRGFETDRMRYNHIIESVVHSNDRRTFLCQKDQVCDLCGATVHLCFILEHVRAHVGDYAKECPTCPQIFSNSQSLKFHRDNYLKCKAKRGDRKLEFTCETCGFKSNQRMNIRGFRMHLMRNHERSDEKKFSCPILTCDKTFTVRQSVDFHIGEEHAYKNHRKLIKCEICSQCISVELIEKHYTSHHNISKLFKCRSCLMPFPSNNLLINHVYSHRPLELYCVICGDDDDDSVTYISIAHLKNHYATAHNISAEEEIICEYCSKKFNSLLSLRSHIKIHHSFAFEGNVLNKETIEKNFSCDLCSSDSVTFKSEEALVSHKILAHGDDPFKCKRCGAKFSRVSNLTRHEKEIHTLAGIKYFQETLKCKETGCGKIFKTTKSLRQHKEVHSRQRRNIRFVCDSCGKVFGNKGALRRHNKAVHLGMKEYMCDVCGTSLKCAANLKRHMMIHTGEKPLACSFCDKRFRDKKAFRNHKRSHHEKKGEPLNENYN